jgi:hypothetical protein
MKRILTYLRSLKARVVAAYRDDPVAIHILIVAIGLATGMWIGAYVFSQMVRR